MSIPLVQNNEKDSINTSIIAIKKNLERINSLLGLVDSGSDIDTSEFVKKSDIVDVVQSGNMNPVTSNAVVPVDTVTSGDMHSVTSNAVAELFQVNSTVIKNFLDTTTRGSFTVSKSGWYYLYISNKSNAPNQYIFLYRGNTSAINMIAKVNQTSGGYDVMPVYLEKDTTYVYEKNSMTTTYVETACLKQ